MAWLITYNGFGSEGDADAGQSWSYLTVSDHRSEPMYADDERTIISTFNRVTGTAHISYKPTATTRRLDQVIQQARALLAATEKTLVIKTNGQTIVNIDPDNATPANRTGDIPGYPRCTATINKIVGDHSAHIAFEIEWFERLDSGGNLGDVLSHWWASSFDIDEEGVTTWEVNGELQTRLHLGESSGAHPNTLFGINPDRYRCILAPDVPDFFRIQSQSWGVSPDGRRMVYRVAMREHARMLPKPARTGSGTFQWRRAIEGGGVDAMGVKIFNGELVGDRNANRGEMLAALTRASSKRIKYGGQDADLIVSLAVTESDIFSGNRIGLQVVARSVGASVTSPFGIGPNLSLNSSLVEPGDAATPPSAFGASLIRAMQRLLFSPGSAIDTQQVDPADSTDRQSGVGRTMPAGPDAPDDCYEYSLGEDTPDFAIPTIEQGLYASVGALNETAHVANPYTSVSVSESIYTRTNQIAMPSQSINGRDRVFQIRRPDVFIVSEFVTERLNAAPDRTYLTQAPGTMVVHEVFHVERGPVDANGNRTVRGVFRRVARVLDGSSNGEGNGGTGFASQNITWGGQSMSVRTWFPPGSRMRMPFDPRTDAQTNGIDTDGGNLLGPHLTVPALTFDLGAPTEPLYT